FPILALICLSAVRTRRAGLRRELLWFAAAFATPFTVVVAIYAAHGKLGELWYWIYRYNAEIYMQPYRGQPWTRAFATWLRDASEARIVLFSLIAVVIAATAAALFELRRWRALLVAGPTVPAPDLGPEVDIAVCLLAVSSIAGAVAPLR